MLQVLGELDPRYGLDPDTRWMSTLRPSHSPHLRRGLADTLAIMGARGATVQVAGQPIEQWATRIVRKLLESANSDWRIWASLETLLSTIVQAAPATFLDAVDAGLRQDQPILKLFQESTHGFFGSSPYTGLLFALELLSWSEEHLAHTTLVLATLTRFDPGGTLSNRPRSSLSGTFFLRHPQTAASWERQLEILKMLLDREPGPGWQLHADVLPSQGLMIVRPKPQWCDWVPATDPTLTNGEYRGRIRDVVMQMLSVVGTDGTRWSDLIGRSTMCRKRFMKLSSSAWKTLVLLNFPIPTELQSGQLFGSSSRGIAVFLTPNGRFQVNTSIGWRSSIRDLNQRTLSHVMDGSLRTMCISLLEERRTGRRRNELLPKLAPMQFTLFATRAASPAWSNCENVSRVRINLAWHSA